jgi:hypothetical protein
VNRLIPGFWCGVCLCVSVHSLSHSVLCSHTHSLTLILLPTKQTQIKVKKEKTIMCSLFPSFLLMGLCRDNNFRFVFNFHVLEVLMHNDDSLSLCVSLLDI